eukprot:3422190-Amphidinium_carterae.1
MGIVTVTVLCLVSIGNSDSWKCIVGESLLSELEVKAMRAAEIDEFRKAVQYDTDAVALLEQARDILCQPLQLALKQ